MKSPVTVTLGKSLALIALVVFCGVFLRHQEIPKCHQIHPLISAFGIWAPAAFVIFYIVGTVLFIPGTILTLVAGIIFGPCFGTLYVIAGSVTGAVASFLIARYAFRNLAQNYLRRQYWFSKLEAQFAANSFGYMLFLRLSPIFPFNGLNYASGLLPSGVKTYLLSSIIGMFPGTVIYVYAGYTIGCAALDKQSLLDSSMQKQMFYVFVSLSILSIVPLLFKKKPKE